MTDRKSNAPKQRDRSAPSETNDLHAGSTIPVLPPDRDGGRGRRRSSAAGRWRSDASVLIIDDEAGVRRVAKRILERCGLRVLSAESGPAALEMVDGGEHIDAVLLDLTMPEMDGAETFHALRQRLPEVPVLLFSGYSKDEVRRHFEGAKAPQLIEKPFSPGTLIDAIRETLEARSAL